MHRRLYPRRNSPVSHFTGGRVGLGSCSDGFKNYPPPPVFKPQTVHLYSESQYYYYILAANRDPVAKKMRHNFCMEMENWNRELFFFSLQTPRKSRKIQGGSNMTETDLCVNKPHCAAAVRPWESEATTSTLPPARVTTCSVLSGSC